MRRSGQCDSGNLNISSLKQDVSDIVNKISIKSKDFLQNNKQYTNKLYGKKI